MPVHWRKYSFICFLVFLFVLTLALGACSPEIFDIPCGGGCPDGQVCSEAGTCGSPTDLGSADRPLKMDVRPSPDLGCPSGTLCGQPAVCCKSGEECVEGKCLPACASGIRCLWPTVICCQSSQVCLAGTCTTPGQVCKDSFDCPAGYFCEPTLGKCLPQPTGSKCEVKPQSITFNATQEWTWQGYSKDSTFHEVAASPSVADLDQDSVPEVVFPAYNHATSGNAMLVVLDGATGKEELTIPYTTYNLSAWCSVALGNLDTDAELEMVAIAATKGVVVLEHTGTEKWTQAGGSLANVAARKVYPHPLVADLNGDGYAEVVVGAVVLSSSGTILVDKGMIGANSSWIAPAAADLDEDGKLDLVGGNLVYDGTGKQVWKNTAAPDGLVAVADLDLDGFAEVITVSSGYVRALRGTGKMGKTAGEVVFGPVAIPGGGVGGAPTVGDFDGDGRPEISAAGKGKYTVYDLDCKAGATSLVCPSGRTDGILWEATTQDISSSVTGSSLFDFEGDGRVEVVYNDECHLYVLDGKTGKQLMKKANTSRTASEYPLIADVDGDNNSEFVVPANDDQIIRDKCTPPGTRGITVFGDSADRWVRTRPVWNEHTYHITNITAAGQIPKQELRNWDQKGLNNFRQNLQGEGVFNAPDLTVVGLSASTLGCPQKLGLKAQVSNLGSLGVKAGIKVAFYLGTPTGQKTLLKILPTQKALLPGNSETLTLDYPLTTANLGPFSFFVRVDDDGKGQGAETECNETNNQAQLTQVYCPLIK